MYVTFIAKYQQYKHFSDIDFRDMYYYILNNICMMCNRVILYYIENIN